MRRLRGVLLGLVVVAIAVRIIWWAIEPMLPFLLIALVLVAIVGGLLFRTRRW